MKRDKSSYFLAKLKQYKGCFRSLNVLYKCNFYVNDKKTNSPKKIKELQVPSATKNLRVSLQFRFSLKTERITKLRYALSLLKTGKYIRFTFGFYYVNLSKSKNNLRKERFVIPF